MIKVLQNWVFPLIVIPLVSFFIGKEIAVYTSIFSYNPNAFGLFVSLGITIGVIPVLFNNYKKQRVLEGRSIKNDTK